MKLLAPGLALATALAGAAFALAAGSAEPGARRLPGLPGVERVEPARRHAARRIRLGAADRVDRARQRRARRLRVGPLRRVVDRHPLRRRHGKTTPKSRVKFDYADESDKGPYPIPSNVPIEGYPHSGDGDRHALIVDRDTCRLYELYALHRSGSGWAAGSGAIWNLRSNALRPAGWTSADAAGLPDPPRPRALGRGRRRPIDHALRFTASRTRNTYIYPARHEASSSTDPSLPPMGLRVRLKASVDISQLPLQARIVAQAMKTLRADPGRQRVALVRLGRTEPALVERPAPRARCPARLRLRGRRHLEAASVTAAAARRRTSRRPPAGCRRERRRPSPSASCLTIASPRPLPTGRSRPNLS